MQRIRFPVDTDTGVSTAPTTYKSGPVTGWLQRMRWYPDALANNDTGTGDTGQNFDLYRDLSDQDTGNSLLLKSVVQAGAAQFDTGKIGSGGPIPLCQETLRLVVTPGNADGAGSLYVWISDEK